MRASQSLPNPAAMNLGLHDVFSRDGFKAWQQAIDRVPARVDTLLGIRHIDLESLGTSSAPTRYGSEAPT